LLVFVSWTQTWIIFFLTYINVLYCYSWCFSPQIDICKNISFNYYLFTYSSM